jgi:hypothetical protein
MTKAEQLTAIAERLSDDQIESLLFFARSMAEKPYYDTASPEALASIERGLRQIDRDETVSLTQLSERLARAAKPQGS